MLRKAFSSIVVVTLMLALGAGGATGSAKAAQAEQGKPKELVYTHGLVWNHVLPGLAGQLLLTFDVRVDLMEEGPGFGTISDSVHPEANLHFSIDSATRAGNTLTLQGTVIQANDPANLDTPVSLFAKFHAISTEVTIELGGHIFQGAAFNGSGFIEKTVNG